MKKTNKKDAKSIKKPIKSNISHKLKFVRKFSAFNNILSEIAIFDDKKILAKSPDEIKVYDNKFNLIYKNAKHTIEYLKILDNDNILLLNSEHQLINLNIKKNKSKILFKFKHEFSKFLYISKDIIITAEEELVKGIKIWKLINNWTYQLVSVLKFPKDNLDHIFPLIYYYKTNNLLLTNDTKYGRANFWDLKKCKIKDFVLLNVETDDDYKILSFCPIKNDVFIFGRGEADFGAGIFNLVLYDFKGKKILLEKGFDYFITEIAYIKEKDVILTSGGSHDYQPSDIYMYDGSLNELQFIPRINYTGVCGFTYYEKNVKEKFILVCSVDGEMFVYSIF
jgi:hypothetical protein